MRISDEFKYKVIDATDIVQLIGRYTRLTKKGARYSGLCPFPDHSEKTPSFSVEPSKQLYYCFGCHKGGNVINFVMEMFKYSYPEAVEFLAKQANLPMEFDRYDAKEESRYTQRKIIYELNRQAGNFYYKNLIRNKKSLEYLYDRGITASAVKEFGLGLSSGGDELYRYLSSLKFKREDMLAANLVRTTDGRTYDYFRNRIMFPILDVANNIVGFGGRVMDNTQPKYLNSPENVAFYKNSTLYNLNKAKIVLKDDVPLIVVEGYMDVISLYDKGVKNVCATLGTALGERHAKMIKRYSENVVLCYDGDKAGRTSALRGADILENASLGVKVLVLPVEHDPDSFIREYGREEFEKKVAEASYTTDFIINEAAAKYDMGDIEQRKKFLYEACAGVAKIHDEIKWDHYAKILSEISSAQLATVKGIIMKTAKGGGETERSDNYRSVQTTEKEDSNLVLDPQQEMSERMQTAVLKFIMGGYDRYKLFLKAGGDSSLFGGEYEPLFRETEELYALDDKVDIFQKILYNNKVTHSAAKVGACEYEIEPAEIGGYVTKLKEDMYDAMLKSLKKKMQMHNIKGTEDEALLLKEYSYIKTKLLELKAEANLHG